MNPLPSDFCVFILSHGRPEKIVTYKTLMRGNYSGPLYIVIDNEDKTADKYFEKFGKDSVIVFDKKAEADLTDEGHNFDNRGGAVYARNAVFRIAENLGYKYFMVLDDDYKEISYKIIDRGKTKQKYVKDLNQLFANLLDFYKSIDAKSIAFAQGGDFFAFSDKSPNPYPFSKRKCMNSFFCSTDRPYKFVGNPNEDVSTIVALGSRGDLFLTVPNVGLWQKPTQSQQGGISELYITYGTYMKSFLSVMMQPSSIKVGLVGVLHPRLHHKINWKTAVPMIIREQHRKDD